VGYPRPANLAYIRIAPSVQGRSREASRWAGRGAAPARTCTQHELPGGAGASSGPLGVPARNWLTPRQAIRGDAGGEKQGP